MFGFIGKAVKSAGKAIGGAAESIGGAVKSIPVVGKPISVAYGVTVGPQVKFFSDVANGKRIDRAAYNGFKETVKVQQAAAPYAATIAANVPGIGTGVAAAIAGANALSKGQRIDAAIMSGVRASVPGGLAGQAIFDVSVAAAQGKPITTVALQAVPLDPIKKQALLAAIRASGDLVRGKPVSEVAINNALASIPQEYRAASSAAIAIAGGKRLQDIALEQGPTVISKMAAVGNAEIAKSPALQSALRTMQSDVDKTGFARALGLMSHKLTPATLSAAEKAVTPAERGGFIAGVAYHIATTEGVGGSAAEKIGIGLRGSKRKSKLQVKHALKPAALRAAVRANKSVWRKILDYLKGTIAHGKQ